MITQRTFLLHAAAFLFGMTAVTTAHGAGLPEEITSPINTFCQAEWPNDVEMTVYCIEQERESAAAMLETMSRAIETQDTDSVEMLRGCKAEWPYEWGMVAYCFEQKQEAAAKLSDLLGD